MRRIIVLAAAGLLVLCGTVFAAAEVFKRTETRRDALGLDVARVLIKADGGDVTVRAGVSPAILLESRTTWVISKPSVTRRIEGDTLVIESSCDPLTSALRCSAELDLAVPPLMDVEVQARTADIRLRGLQGRVTASTETGDLETDRLEAVVFEGSTETGDADLDIVGTPTRIAATTESGDVTVVVPYGAYRVDAAAGSGAVDVEGVLRDDLAIQRLELRTDAGDIAVRTR